jgi:predicted ABC-type ATPase
LSAAEIAVLAGTNGAGKSTVAGEALRGAGGDYFNPDEAAAAFIRRRPDASREEANAWAWNQGRRTLERAIEQRLPFAFETTLGGNTVTGLLLKAANLGIPVRMWYVGLASPELHIERVRARVSRGGHDIPEPKIRERYESSRRNLIRLLPHLTELKVYDNSADLGPAEGKKPNPLLILHIDRGEILESCALAGVPEWAKPIVQAAINAYGQP